MKQCINKKYKINIFSNVFGIVVLNEGLFIINLLIIIVYLQYNKLIYNKSLL